MTFEIVKLRANNIIDWDDENKDSLAIALYFYNAGRLGGLERAAVIAEHEVLACSHPQTYAIIIRAAKEEL